MPRGEHKRSYIASSWTDHSPRTASTCFRCRRRSSRLFERSRQRPRRFLLNRASASFAELRICWMRLEKSSGSARTCVPAFPSSTVRLNRYAITSSWRADSPCIGSANGGSRIVIRSARFSPLSASVSCSATSRRTRRWRSSSARPRVVQNRNTLLSIRLPSRLIRNSSSKRSTGRTKKVTPCHRSILACSTARSHACRSTTGRWRGIHRMS